MKKLIGDEVKTVVLKHSWAVAPF